MKADTTSVEFRNVGRGKASWKADLPDLSHETLIREIKHRKVTASKYLDLEDDENGVMWIVAGSRYIGKVVYPHAD